jgi:hypothetical protein
MGRRAVDGDEYTAVNGYKYRKVDGKFRAVHHLIAEETLGRPLTPDDRVGFADGDRSNLSPDNIVVKRKKNGKAQRIEALETRIKILQEELDDLRS